MVRRRAFANGFTLVELMVVIVIIMILASMLLVGFSRAQKRAQAAQCMNNMRQIGALVISYATQQGGGYLPDFSLHNSAYADAKTSYMSRDAWVLQLDFVNEENRWVYVDKTKIIPPRMAPAVLRCPADVRLFVNSQSVLCSYWMHPENSYKQLASITNQGRVPLALEADPFYIGGGCGCRYRQLKAPVEIDTTHFGGAHILFVDGSVELFTDPVKRRLATWEDEAGWPHTTLWSESGRTEQTE